MPAMNRPQLVALRKLWLRNTQGMTFLAFRRTVSAEIGWPGVRMVRWSGMWVGIEEDGHTHT